MVINANFMTGGALALLVALGAPVRAQVVVVPRRIALRPGQVQLFRAQGAGPRADGQQPACLWRLAEGGTGELDETTGAFTAPPVDEVRTVRIQAVPRDGSGPAGEAEATLLPHDPFQLLDKVLGEDWLAPFSADLPFLDLETGCRFPVPGRVLEKGASGAARIVPCGYGLPCRLPWAGPAGAAARLLSYREGGQVVRRDVTGQDAPELVPRAPVRACRIEALVPAGPGGLPLLKHPVRYTESHVQSFRVDVRGMFPFAGNTVADRAGDGWHLDGAGPAARFREPFGLAEALDRDDSGRQTWNLLVTDPASHVLRLVDREGRVTTLCGEPGRAGHRDTPCLLRRAFGCSPAPRFNRPTHVAAQRVPWREPGRGWRAFVADSGNHVIRQVGPDGRVETLAGCPGIAGHADRSDPLLSLFRDPQGVCAGILGVFVADRGNHVVRWIDTDGGVMTLAGSPGQPGTQDGSGRLAQFSALQGIAFVPDLHGLGPHLLVVDGHAVRGISITDRAVTTVLGSVREPGFREVQDGGLEDRRRALREPCLRDPVGLLWSNGRLYVADRGNHAVRQVDLAEARLKTLAGDPDRAETRWGLLRDGLAGALPPGYAALEAPATLAPGAEGTPVSLLAPTGRGLAELRSGGAARDRLEAALGELAPAERNQDLVVPFRAATRGASGHATEVPLHCTVEFLEPDGTLAARREVVLPRGGDHSLRGAFTQAGTGTVALRVVSGQGVSAGMRRTVAVR